MNPKDFVPTCAVRLEMLIHFEAMPKKVEIGECWKLPRFGIQGEWRVVGFDVLNKTIKIAKA